MISAERMDQIFKAIERGELPPNRWIAAVQTFLVDSARATVHVARSLADARQALQEARQRIAQLEDASSGAGAPAETVEGEAPAESPSVAADQPAQSPPLATEPQRPAPPKRPAPPRRQPAPPRLATVPPSQGPARVGADGQPMTPEQAALEEYMDAATGKPE
jgi:hypothetical protein